MSDIPNPFPCGGKGQQACSPKSAAVINGTAYYTLEQMHEHGHANYQKGRKDVIDAVNEVLENPGPAWGGGELAAALRKALGE